VVVSEAPPKPRLRGWLHLGAFPFALLSGLWLTANGLTHADRVACAVFTLTACMLFGTSAVYHRGKWSPQAAGVLRRLDHSNIALIIAGTYTPIAVAVLPSTQATVLLCIVWSTATMIVVFRVAWLTAPRWLYTTMYVGLGWAAIFWLPELWHLAGAVTILLIALGGLLYTAGAVVYALRRPRLSPQSFGYHELFHACTIAAFTCHLVAVARVAT
jgi:hemolysin III